MYKEMRANRLINKKSPYLLQHAYNPVEWFPWSEEAFRKAKEENKPIFLSIGYSTCHWCHVMEKESFEDEEIAQMMNESFVNIKVDREERPDLDGIYMAVCQMMTGGGGWPLTVIMTPERKPFFAATYIPKESKFSRLGMKELIKQIDSLWKTRRYEIDKISEEVFAVLKENRFEKKTVSEQILHDAFSNLAKSFDEKNGGFGDAPKFPSSPNLLFLLRYWKMTGNAKALNMIEKSLIEMRLGGIFDHIGFGFHRYSTDSCWLLPHFEKMLYDQAMLLMAYTEAYQLTKSSFFRKTAEEIIEYVLRDMTSEEGAFYSAEDADSEGEEGKFYLWTKEELRDYADELFLRIYNVQKEGNFKEESTGLRTGKNILYLRRTLPEISLDLKIPYAELEKHVENIRQKLFRIREEREHPLKDDKVLTDWNGLMIAALSKASNAFDRKEYLIAAKKAADFILEKMVIDGRVYHRYREGEVAITGFLDDYAFLVWGLLELYEATFDIKYLRNAIKLAERMIEIFEDKDGGFYFSEAKDNIVRRKEIYDSAYFSGNSIAVLNLIKIARITGRTEFENIALRNIESIWGVVSRVPSAFTGLMVALLFAFKSYEVVIAGDYGSDDTRAMIQALREEFIPNKVAILKSEGEEINEVSDFVKNLSPIEGKATAYVCKNFKCSMPTTDILKMKELISE